jgi:hypothetical protein
MNNTLFKSFTAPLADALTLRSIGLLVFLGSAISCASTGEAQLDQDAVQCTTPRPQMCTADYRPVCATLNDGNELATYSNGCSACGDARVISHVVGECEQ